MEGISPKYMDDADSLSKKYSAVIDEKAVYFKNSDMDGGKAITNGCFIFYLSKELDSIANIRYKQYIADYKKIYGSYRP